ncbi:MAG: hypothetical protein UV73_C0004G0030 [Candidatus Gottesmanbacteria bacterium GW2011_GWA2_43_14]|uniref:Uncharacterized protein n=1 Tax=Candidatus Gottesmanbacteria bacterium GW2011_GWA2_43_14 TaxID=1618443 RepID=A0A0G1GGF4_9BACT|nr:MAG: hypothetical protein UV73_C0004G0030 [Candidatus Gottesmanbacteria bacterium GW2011_GWA2_43_14]
MQLAQVSIAEKYPPAKNFPTLASIISSFLPNLLIIAGVIFFILTIVAGFVVISTAGQGDPHGAERAKSFLTYSVIGLFLIFASYWILQIINYISFGSMKGLF